MLIDRCILSATEKRETRVKAMNAFIESNDRRFILNFVHLKQSEVLPINECYIISCPIQHVKGLI